MNRPFVSIQTLFTVALAAVAVGCAPAGSNNGGGGGEGGAVTQDGGLAAGGAGGAAAGGAGGEGGAIGGAGGGAIGGAGGEGGVAMGGAGGEGGVVVDEADPSEGSGTCQGTTFTADSDVAFIEAYGAYYQAIDPSDPATAMIIEVHDDRGGPVTPGVYDLEGQNLDTCQICVLACTVANNRCTSIYMAQEGVVEVTARGVEFGEPLQMAMHRVRYAQVNIDQDTRLATPVPNGDAWCADGYEIDTDLKVRPAEVGQPVHDFQLQNCLSEEFVSLKDLSADLKALWMIATAGWCPACREYIPQAIDAGDQIPESDMKMIFVVGEDASYGQPTLAYCRQYASHYGEDGSRFFIDHNGEGSFATTFSFVWPYVGDNGEFGLPWNAAFSGGDFTYRYGDGFEGQRGGVTGVINGLLR
jgi:thiol-disulfide isomerase/thioredoxin